MSTSAVTAVTQLINEGRLRHGDIAAVEVAHALWEQTMEEVAAAGGAVGFDHCMVDDVEVRRLADDGGEAVLVLGGSGRRETLSGS